jgi:predicted small metal-binding protein
LTKLRCSDYGFECNFITEGDVDTVVSEFGKHSDKEHGIEYTKEALMYQFISQKENKK